MKKILTFILVSYSLLNLQAQNGHFYGGYEAYLQYYQNDTITNFTAPHDKFRAMNFLSANYAYKFLKAGVQYEAFVPQSLLGYSPELKGNGLATYYIQLKKESWDITAGYFYDQFGSGLVFRSWEDRQLGINNAVRGIRFKYKIDDIGDITAFTGNQRINFKLSESTLSGINADISLSKLIDYQDINIDAGFSYVNRYQETQSVNPDLKPYVGSFSSRLGLDANNFYTNFEYVYKESDARASNNVLLDQVLFDGNAWLLNFGYAKKGIGFNATLRRLENIQMYSERLLEGNSYNTGIMNFIPGLSKQHDFSLANLYVYQAQPGISFGEEKVGEIGGQADLFFRIKRKTFLGGRYGTKIALNFSRWHGLNARFDHDRKIYRADFAKPGTLYFQDINMEIRKKLSRSNKITLNYINLIYNKLKLEGEGETVHAGIVVGDWEHKFLNDQSMRLELQHLNTRQDMKNWAAATFEYYFSQSFSTFATDMYNYGNDDEKIHYFNLGLNFTHNRTRVGLSYGRQRGGLLCVGGVCRYVPPSKGFTVNLSTSF